MSNAVYPSLPGLGIEVTKEPEFSTLIQRAVNGKEYRIGQMVYPLWNITLVYNFLRDTTAYPELKQLGGFFLSRNAELDNFLLLDPDDQSVTDQVIGVGNGSTVLFQLARPFGSFIEPVFNPNVITSVKVNGSTVSYTALANGVVQLASPAGSGQNVTWTGTFYYRVRFADKKLSLEKFLYQVWKTGRVRLVGSLQDKI